MASFRRDRILAGVLPIIVMAACAPRRDVVHLGAERAERGGDRACGRAGGKLGRDAASGEPRVDVDALECAARTARDVEGLQLASRSTWPTAATCDSAQCYDGFHASGDALADVRLLGDRCGQGCGLGRMTKAYEVPARDDEAPRVFSIELDAATCYRVLAVGGDGVRVLRAALVDGRGHVVSIDNSRDRAPMLGPRDPFCPSAGGLFRLVVAVERGAGTYAFQVWSRPRAAE